MSNQLNKDGSEKIISEKLFFHEWCDKVKEEYQRIAGFIPDPFDEEAYRDYYDDDYTPTDTVNEDLSYAD